MFSYLLSVLVLVMHAITPYSTYSVNFGKMFNPIEQVQGATVGATHHATTFSTPGATSYTPHGPVIYPAGSGGGGGGGNICGGWVGTGGGGSGPKFSGPLGPSGASGGIAVLPNQAIDVHVGAAGRGGTGSASDCNGGETGGDTYLGLSGSSALFKVAGGSGGGSAVSGTIAGGAGQDGGGTGGSTSGGSTQNNAGNATYRIGTSNGAGGTGGGSTGEAGGGGWGNGANATTNTLPAAGGIGAGGATRAASGISGDAGPGILVVEEFY
jgi:hypothetical protein